MALEITKGIHDNLRMVQDSIANTAQRVGRDASDVTLVVVTKGHSIEHVKAVLSAGAQHIGENYAEQALPKILATREQYAVKWHMIGHVQSRKARLVCEHFNFLHSLDRIKLAQRLDTFCAQLDCSLPVLVECNVSGEETKFGLPAWDEDRWHLLIPDIRQMLSHPRLDICGLMTMAPFTAVPEETRPYFKRLRDLRDFLAGEFPDTDWRELSMGMSSDYKIAIEEGATIVRIGQAILGPRVP